VPGEKLEEISLRGDGFIEGLKGGGALKVRKLPWNRDLGVIIRANAGLIYVREWVGWGGGGGLAGNVKKVQADVFSCCQFRAD
jgi:hypothetical protein